MAEYKYMVIEKLPISPNARVMIAHKNIIKVTDIQSKERVEDNDKLLGIPSSQPPLPIGVITVQHGDNILQETYTKILSIDLSMRDALDMVHNFQRGTGKVSTEGWPRA